MLEDKQQFSVVKDDASSMFDRKSPKSSSQKRKSVDRKTVRRRKIIKSDDWYEKAVLSLAISAKQ